MAREGVVVVIQLAEGNGLGHRALRGHRDFRPDVDAPVEDLDCGKHGCGPIRVFLLLCAIMLNTRTKMLITKSNM